MLDYTKAAFNKILNDLKRLLYAIEIISNAFTVLYLAYSVIVGNGFLWANVPLLILTGGFLIFFLIVTKGRYDYDKNNRLRRRVKVIVKYGKRIIKTGTLGISVYGFFIMSGHVTPVNALLTALMIIGWVLQVVFDIVVHVITSYASLLTTAVETDVENIMRPVKSVGNFFKKMSGQEVEPPPEPTKEQVKQRAILEKTIVKTKQSLALKKAALKEKQQLRKDEKKREKEEQKRKKSEAKEAKKQK